MRRTLMAAALLTMSACVTAQDGIPPREDARFRCNAERLVALIGRAGTPRLAEQARRASGARAFRWIRPGTAVTMDYRTDRLNIEVDAGNRVIELRCG